jgi:hypothetical protein
VIKVSAAVSGEIVFERLIDALMRAAIEHAGAERDLLIVPRAGDYQIEAEATTTTDDVNVVLRHASITAADKSAYSDLLTLWKNADPDIPVLKETRAEYARLP